MKYPVGLTVNIRAQCGDLVRPVTIVDYHTTLNLAGEVVRQYYVVEYERRGEKLRSSNILERTIGRAIAIAEKRYSTQDTMFEREATAIAARHRGETWKQVGGHLGVGAERGRSVYWQGMRRRWYWACETAPNVSFEDWLEKNTPKRD